MQLDVMVTIDAPPAQVWAVLADVERWPEWTASMRRVQPLDPGAFGVDSRAHIRQPRLLPMVWRVTDFEPRRGFAWETRGLGATTVADHRLVADDRHGTTVMLTVRQTGPLARLFSPWTAKLVRRYLEMEAQGLKRRCEAAPEARELRPVCPAPPASR